MKAQLGILLAAAVVAPAHGAARTAAVRDVEGYAVASCLIAQRDPVLKAQGEGWASAIIQRGRGGLEPLQPVRQAVSASLASNGVAVARQDGAEPGGVALPVMTCGEIVDRPAVRAAIDGAIARLRAAYR